MCQAVSPSFPRKQGVNMTTRLMLGLSAQWEWGPVTASVC